MKQIIQSTKRISQASLFTVAADAVEQFIVLQATQDFTGGSGQCPVGAVVKAVYVEMWMMGDGQQPSFQMAIVEKSQGNATVASIAALRDLDNFTNKKNIFHTFQGLIGDANTNPMPIIRQWIKIPRGKQRMGLGDRIRVVFGGLDPVGSVEVCGFTIAKYYQ